jgi:hypothetical protein
MKEEDATGTDFDAPVVNNYTPALVRSVENITTALDTALGVSIERNDVSPTKDSTSADRIVAQEAAPAVPMTHNSNSTPTQGALQRIRNRKPAAKPFDRMSSALGLVNATNPRIAQHLHKLSLAPVTSTIPWSNETTLAYAESKIASGFRNQMMVFTLLILEANRYGHGQVLLDSISQKDLHGSEQFIPFRDLWDIEHWNQHHPQLPRLVEYDPIVHEEFRIVMKTKFRYWASSMEKYNSQRVRPYASGSNLLVSYTRYAGKRRGPYIQEGGRRNPAELLMFQGALRPSLYLRQLIDQHVHRLTGRTTSSSNNETIDYMTLHARVEPDMQRHPVCPDKKVLNLTDIFEFMESHWKDPPALHVFMPINRQLLEKKVKREKRKNKGTDSIAIENLKALNRARDEGLWGGRAKIFEAGAPALMGTTFEQRRSTTGSLLDFFIGVNAKIFIGTEVSSFSHDLLATRFYRGMMENYKYLPDGLHPWTPPGTEEPPGLQC